MYSLEGLVCPCIGYFCPFFWGLDLLSPARKVPDFLGSHSLWQSCHSQDSVTWHDPNGTQRVSLLSFFHLACCSVLFIREHKSKRKDLEMWFLTHKLASPWKVTLLSKGRVQISLLAAHGESASLKYYNVLLSPRFWSISPEMGQKQRKSRFIPSQAVVEFLKQNKLPTWRKTFKV